MKLPQRSIAKADRLAEMERRERADVLGDLVAQQLPELLAITARALLTESEGLTVPPNQAAVNARFLTEAPTPPAATDGVVHLNELSTQATQIVSPGDLFEEGPPGYGKPG